MTDDEPIPPPKRRVWLIVLLAVGIPVLCGLVCCGGLGYWLFNAGKELIEAKNSAELFLNELAGKRVDQAYQSASLAYKQANSLEEFRTLVAKYPALTSGSSPQLAGMQVLQQPGVKKAAIKENVSGGGTTTGCTLTLVLEGAVWKVEGFTVP